MSAIDVMINGEAHQVPPRCTLQDLIARLELAHQALALAVNRTVVPRQQWPARELVAGDSIDIVRAIGGG